MSSTSCCGVKYCVRLHCGFTGYDAEGVPHEEMSIDDVEFAWANEGGTFGLYGEN